ncbi:MAG: SHOCT domain-containing protein [Gammaproteobacteria bacterium]|nr:SHOCT domain-containing protein [Gammaproteobacteria bacterium]
MDQDSSNAEIAAAECRIADLTMQIERGKEVVQQCTDANTNLSRSAAEARAENQSSGRGFFAGLLGPKYRSAMRLAAASSNAAIAKDVAEKRRKIAEGKREAQDLVKQLQTELSAAKSELKALTSNRQAAAKTKSVAAKNAKDSLSLLEKLKDAHESGILTDDEYEEKRRKLVSQL